MSSLVHFPENKRYAATLMGPFLFLNSKEIEGKVASAITSRLVMQKKKKRPGKLQFVSHFISIYFLVSFFCQKLNHLNFPGDKSPGWRLFFLWRQTSLLVWINCVEWSDNSTGPCGCVWTTYSQTPLETQRTSVPLPWGPLFLIVATRSACRPS